MIFLHAVRVNGNNFGGGLRIEQNGKVFELKNDKKVKRTPSEYKKTWEIDGNTGKFVLEYEGGLQKEHAMSFRKGCM